MIKSFIILSPKPAILSFYVVPSTCTYFSDFPIYPKLVLLLSLTLLSLISVFLKKMLVSVIISCQLQGIRDVIYLVTDTTLAPEVSCTY